MGKRQEWLWFLTFKVVLNSLRFRLSPKNHLREWRVGWRFLRAYTGLLVKVYEDSGVCLSWAWTKTTMNAFRGTFTCISHSSRSRGIFLAQRQWLFWNPPNLSVRCGMPVGRLAIMTRKVWGKKSLWVGFADILVGEIWEWYSSHSNVFRMHTGNVKLHFAN